jgi:uncharacterized protein YcaQ
MTRTISAEEAAWRMIAWTGLNGETNSPTGWLGRLRAIQLDPLDRIGTNAELVLWARCDTARPTLFDHFHGASFEHFAKERCLLSADQWPVYRDGLAREHWFRDAERRERVDPAIVTAVKDEVTSRGPIASADLTDHGPVQAMAWSGWKGTTRATTMALELLWWRCEIVCSRTTGRDRIWDIPARALASHHTASPPTDPAAWTVAQRAQAAGLLPTADGPAWSLLKDARRAGVVDRVVEAGLAVPVRVAGSTSTRLAPPAFFETTRRPDDGVMRILGPLDPLLWDRALLRTVFDFEYVWEVYKPAAARRWGYYVVPLLHLGRLVGRLEARVERGELVVDRVWHEREPVDEDALRAALIRHAGLLGVEPPATLPASQSNS